MNSTSDKMKQAFAFALLIGLTAFVYYPGLSGPFLFDDFGNLERLGELGGIRSWESLKAFITGGISGPTGRPVSLISFLVNAQNWPANPYWFKLTNLLIHTLCGFLIFHICKKLLGISSVTDEKNDREFWVALVASGAWLLHPFLLSTTLYVVQRMAQLATLFCLLGIAGYIRGRVLLDTDKARAYTLMTASIIVFGGLALFSKENGVLLPALILVLELSVMSGSKRMKANSIWWRNTFLVLPSVLILAYLFSRLQHPFTISLDRGFSTYERLLTEARVLVDYLRNLYIPEYLGSAVFHDDFQKSSAILRPISTLWSVLFHGVFITLALVFRHKYNIFSFSILFFYVGHLVESTTVSLELYFEHRNYLPAAFLFLPLAKLVIESFDTKKAILFLSIYLGVFSVITRSSAEQWSSYERLALASAKKSPNSHRAQQQASMVLFNSGYTAEAIEMVDSYLDKRPHDFSMWLWKTILECKSGGIFTRSFEKVEDLSSASLYDQRELELYRMFVTLPTDKYNCGIKAADIEDVLEKLSSFEPNKARSETYAQLQYFLGVSASYRKDGDVAVEYFKKSLKFHGGPDAAMDMASQLAVHGFYQSALELSDLAIGYVQSGSYGITLQSRASWLENVKYFQAAIRKEIHNAEEVNQDMK